jgi:sporulation protein YlmC with PRC-barrel domain
MQLRDLLDKPVISAWTGDDLGRVAEVVIDIQAGRVTGFRLRRGGLFDRRWRVAAVADVVRVDAAGIYLVHAAALQEDDDADGRLRLGRRGVSVLDESGRPLGVAKDGVVASLNDDVAHLLVATRSDWRRPKRRPIDISLADLRLREDNSLVLGLAVGWFVPPYRRARLTRGDQCVSRVVHATLRTMLRRGLYLPVQHTTPIGGTNQTSRRERLERRHYRSNPGDGTTPRFKEQKEDVLAITATATFRRLDPRPGCPGSQLRPFQPGGLCQLSSCV